MRINDAYLLKRTQKDLIISDETYITGFLYTLCYLFRELKILLIEENRFFGIMISYMNSIEQAYKDILPEITEDDEVIYQKILFLHKPVIIKEYRKLCKRGVSRADSLISVIKKILDILLDYQHPYQKEIKTLDKIITKIYDNIRNSGKRSKMPFLTITFKKYIDLGIIGNKPTTKFSIIEEENKRVRKKLENPDIILDESGKSEIVEEIEWTEK